MAINDKVDLVLQRYARQPFPTIPEALDRYLQDELRRLETAIQSLSEASIQATDEPPANPRKGTVRFALSPWDPLGNGTLGLVVYNGTAWVAV